MRAAHPRLFCVCVCARARRHSNRPLLLAVAIGAVPMLARLSIGMYVLAVQGRQCREAGACDGSYAVGWFGLCAEMFSTVAVCVASAHHLRYEMKTQVAQERAVFEAAEEKKRNKGVAELKQSLKKSFKSWCEKRLLLSHLYLKTIILPRQARDKHRKS
jgi:hypothetical protein